MIFAPRSWPSRPGLAITTRILCAIGAAVYGGASHASLVAPPRLAEPRRRRPFRRTVVVGHRPASARLVDPGVLSPGCVEREGGWPQIDSIVISHWHLDHWGDLVPWVWGGMFGLGREPDAPSSGCRPDGDRPARTFGERIGTPTMFCNAFELEEYAEARTVRDRGRADDHADPGTALHARRPSLSGSRTATDARVLGRLGAERRARRGRPRRRPLRLRGDARRRATSDGEPAVTSRPTRRSRPSRRQAPGGCCSRTGRRSSTSRRGSSALRTGSSSTCRGGRPPRAVAATGRGSTTKRSRRPGRRRSARPGRRARPRRAPASADPVDDGRASGPGCASGAAARRPAPSRRRASSGSRRLPWFSSAISKIWRAAPEPGFG